MIKIFADWLTYTIFNITPKTLVAETVNFFIYDTIKIFLLLITVIFIVSVIRSYFPPEKIRDILSKRKKYVGHILAALLGIIPLFVHAAPYQCFLAL